MFEKLGKTEKMAAIGILKFVINANGIVDEGEIDKVNEFVNEKGFKDYPELAEEFDAKYKNIEDLFELLAEVKKEHRAILIDEAFELAISDGYATPSEMKIFDILSQVWEMDKEKMLKELKGE